MSVILGANNWKTNAELIADCAALGYLDQDALTLDPTYGRGVWWKKFRPDKLVYHDLSDGVDFRDLPYVSDFFQDSVFDPPYISKGGRDSSGILEFDDRYGLVEAAMSPQELHEYNCEGLAEVVNVTRRHVLVKVQNYISSGEFFPGVYLMEKFAVETLHCRVIDQFMMYKTPRMQPERTRKCPTCDGSGESLMVEIGPGVGQWDDCPDCDGEGRIKSTQQHARNNYSVLLVLSVA